MVGRRRRGRQPFPRHGSAAALDEGPAFRGSRRGVAPRGRASGRGVGAVRRPDGSGQLVEPHRRGMRSAALRSTAVRAGRLIDLRPRSRLRYDVCKAGRMQRPWRRRCAATTSRTTTSPRKTETASVLPRNDVIPHGGAWWQRLRRERVLARLRRHARGDDGVRAGDCGRRALRAPPFPTDRRTLCGGLPRYVRSFFVGPTFLLSMPTSMSTKPEIRRT